MCLCSVISMLLIAFSAVEVMTVSSMVLVLSVSFVSTFLSSLHGHQDKYKEYKIMKNAF
jgi:hypothetical protein